MLGKRALTRSFELAVTLAAPLIISVASCSDGTEPAEPEPIRDAKLTEVRLTPDSARSDALNDTIQFRARALDQNGRRMSGVEFAWHSLDEGVAAVASAGVVRSRDNGLAEIVAAASGRADTSLLVVEQRVASVELAPDSARLDSVGATVRFRAHAFDPNGHTVDEPSPSWSSSDETVATVDPSGHVTARGEGAVWIVARAGQVADSADLVVRPPRATGGQEVRTITNGEDLDPDGYVLTVDDTLTRSMGINDTIVVADLPVGDHALELTGVAMNCAVTGDNPRTVTVVENATGATSFGVTCEAVEEDEATGAMEVRTGTSGQELDPDGYVLTVDDTLTRSMGINDTIVVADLPVGDHALELTGVAMNCAVTGDNPRTVTVVENATGATSFGVTCERAVRLTRHSASDSRPRISPDGSRIAFVSDRNGNRDVFVINVDGSGLKALTTHPGDDDTPVWSPSGRSLVFNSKRDGNSDVYVINADGSGLDRLTTDPALDGIYFGVRNAWAPDGSAVTFISSRDGNKEVYVAPISGDEPVRVTNHSAEDFHADWSTSGRIAFSSFRSGNVDIYSISPDGTNLEQLTDDPSLDLVPTWSPSGTFIAFIHRQEMRRMRADGGNKITISRGGEPAWTNDGSKIVYSQVVDRQRDIYIMNPDGSGKRRLTFDGATDHQPSVSTGPVVFNRNADIYILWP